MKKTSLLFVIILFLAAFLRLYSLGSIPAGTTNDESGYIYSAYSIWKTGYDVAGKFLPLSINLDNSFSPVYIYTIAPFVGLFGLSPLTGRLPFALLGIATVAVMYFLTEEITKNKRIAFLSMLILAISPWHIHISRGAFDATFALFFYTFGIYLFMHNSRKGTLAWSLLSFLLAYYSYHGTKIYFIFLIPLLLFSARHELLKRKQQALLFIVGCLAIIGSFFYISASQNVTRGQVFLWNNMTLATKTVDWERYKNTAQFTVRKFFNNKLFYLLRVIRENYLEAFSVEYLFLYGETGGLGGTYGTFYRGVLYIIELPLLLSGFYYLYLQKNKNTVFTILGLLLIAPLPSSLTIDKTYVMRSVMMLPFLVMLSAFGVLYFIQFFSRLKPTVSKSLLLFFIAWYSLLFMNYVYQYFYRYPVYGAESWFKSSKDLALYIGKNKEKYQRVIVVKPGDMFLMQYGLYNSIEPGLIQTAWKTRGDKIVENVRFSNGCLDYELNGEETVVQLPNNTLYIVPENCHRLVKPQYVIRELGDPLRVIWKIYEAN